MSRYQEFDPRELDILPFAEITHTVQIDRFASAPTREATFADFWDSLPTIYAGVSVRKVAQRMADAGESQAPRAAREFIPLSRLHTSVQPGLNPLVRGANSKPARHR